jgi:hypothetical protein
MATESKRPVYQIKVTLDGIRPAIWRRLFVPASITLEGLHDVLQVAFGWTDSHLHDFEARGVHYGQPDSELEMERLDEHCVPLEEVLRKPKDTMNYEYDFGDGWMHKVVLEKVLANAESRDTLSCIAGERACPPEDCGGPWRYAELLNALSDPSNTEHAEMLEWLGDDFEPEHFDLAQVNKVLAGVKRRGLTTRSRATGRKRPAP